MLNGQAPIFGKKSKLDRARPFGRQQSLLGFGRKSPERSSHRDHIHSDAVEFERVKNITKVLGTAQDPVSGQQAPRVPVFACDDPGDMDLARGHFSRSPKIGLG